MFCSSCGTQVSEDDVFCVSCGAKIEHDKAPASPLPVQEEGQAVPIPAASPEVVRPESTRAAVVSPKAARPKGNRTVIVAVAALAVLAACIGAFVGFTMCSGVTQADREAQDPVHDSQLSEGGPADGAAQDEPESSQGGVKESLDAYSWEELSQISDEIGQAASEEEAIDIAATYNLVGPDGKLDGSQEKLVSVDGNQVPVRIVGFAHDDKTGGGKAGITFQFADCILIHKMNPPTPEGAGSNTGGWEASEMRSWLNADVIGLLPEDLASVIVAVDKQTNNKGWSKDTACVTVTSDKMWLPSSRELCGDVDWYDDQVFNDILNSEGREYKLFRDMEVKSEAPNDILVKKYNGEASGWWERSPYPRHSADFLSVGTVGRLHSAAGSFADYAFGVAPCFCV